MSKLKNIDGIIFDVDGVLIDVSTSFTQAIKQTVPYILNKFYVANSAVEDADVLAIKSIEGFNNDWDATYALIELLKEKTNRNEFGKKTKRLDRSERKEEKYQEIQNAFETFYWGDKLFLKNRGIKAPFPCSQGLINNETLIIKKSLLQKLKKKYKLGIATGRNTYEMAFPLKKWKLTPYFLQEYIVTEDDVYEAKPNPAPLLEAKKRMQVKNPIYVGDNINDVIAAKRADILCVYIGKKLGDVQLENINLLEEVIL